MKKKSGGCGGCLGAPVRALSRACDSACDLYMRGMSGCARRVPSGSSAGVVGRGFGGVGAATLRLRVVSSDGADGSDLVRAAAAAKRHQRRVAAEPAEEAVGYHGAAGKAQIIGAAAPAAWAPARKKGGVAAMGTIAEDEPCEFGPDGACAVAPSLKPPRRAGFGAVKAGGDGVVAR